MVITRTPCDVVGVGDGGEMFFRKGSKVRCSTTFLLIKGLVFTLIGMIFSIWTPFQLIMDERMRMRAGFPPFELWVTPPDYLLNVRIFNYTNAERFMKGLDDILRVEELGPVLYRESMTHHNITRNPNSTMTYIARHTATLWEKNTIDMNATITVPNYAVLSMATYLHDAPFFVKFGFNVLLRQLRTEMFKTMTIQNFLWNFSDPILHTAHKLIPHLAPIDNIGMLQRVYENFEDEFTMFIGPEHGPERFSLIDRVRGSHHLPDYGRCDDEITNATEGATYGQFLTRESVLKYWRKSLCRVVKLLYERDVVYDGLDAYKYVAPANSYDRTYPEYNDCYKGYPSLPNGLTDVSNCYYNVPLTASFPHFLHANASVLAKLEGVKPNRTLHTSYMIAEPVTGVPLQSMARSQSNLVVRKLGGFSAELERFSDRVLPMFWLEYNQTGLPLVIWLLVYGAAVCLKPSQIVLIATFFGLGFMYTIRFGRAFTSSDDYRRLTSQVRHARSNRRRQPPASRKRVHEEEMRSIVLGSNAIVC